MGNHIQDFGEDFLVPVRHLSTEPSFISSFKRVYLTSFNVTLTEAIRVSRFFYYAAVARAIGAGRKKLATKLKTLAVLF